MVGSLRVAHCVLSLDVGGLETLVCRLVEAQRAAGLDPSVICLDDAGNLAATLIRCGVDVDVLGRKPGKMDLGSMQRLVSLLNAQGAEVVHTHNFEPYVYGLSARARMPRLTLVHSQHGLVQAINWKKSLFARCSRGLADRLVGVSESVLEHMRSFGWANEANSEHIANGVDTDTFRPDDGARCAGRAQLGVCPGELVVVCVARLAPIKDHATLIRGFDVFSRRAGTPCRLMIVGDGPDSAALKAQAADLDNVYFLGERDDVPSLMAAADVFAMTSVSEGISVSILEAMSSGVVPVVTRVGGNPQIVEDGVTGVLVPTGEPAALADALETLAATPGKLNEMGCLARRSVIERYGFKTMASAYQNLYLNLTEKNQSHVA